MSGRQFILSCESTVDLPTNMQPIRNCDIGCIIAAHSGLGTVAAFFLGDPHAPEN